MAVSSGYGTGVRQALTGKGVANQDISYDPTSGYVKVKGQNFMRPQKMYQGTNFTTQQDFNTSWDAFNKPQQVGAGVSAGLPGAGTTGANVGMGSPSTQASNMGQGVAQGLPTTPRTTGVTGTTQAQPTNETQLNDLIQMLMKQAQNPTPVDVNAIYASPQYAAQQAQAQRGAQQGIRAAQEALGSAGFGRSTALGERAQGVQNQANEYLQTQVLPQLMEAQQQEKQQQLQNQLAMLGVLTQQQQFGETTAQQRGALTGSFLPPEAQQTLNAITNLKSTTEQNWQSMTPEQRTAAQEQGDQMRARLQSMGVDPSLFGADVTSATAIGNVPRAGVRTLGAQQLDRANFESDRAFEFAQTQQEWENMFNTQQFEESNAARIWEQAFKEKDFAQSVKESAASRGLQWASLNQRDKEFIADEAFREKQFETETRLKEEELGAESGAAEEEAASADNYNFLQDSYRGKTAEEAFADLKNRNEDLTAKDYRALSDWIDKNL